MERHTKLLRPGARVNVIPPVAGERYNDGLVVEGDCDPLRGDVLVRLTPEGPVLPFYAHELYIKGWINGN